MQLSNKPDKLVLPFAASGGKNTIPAASQIGIVAGKASLTDGFPPLTRTPLSAGGVPPSGLDMNGILYEMSAVIRWANAGGGYPFDAVFAADANVGGYPKGARVLRSDGLGYWFNTVDNQTVDPEDAGAPAAGWVPDFANGATAVTMTGSNVTLTPLQYGKPVIVVSGALSANLNLIFPAIIGDWTVINATTGAYAITAKTVAGTGAILIPGAQIIVGDGTNVNAIDTFIQPGTGAITRRMLDKARDVISVFDFMTPAQIIDVQSAQRGLDHTAAVAAAINYANAITAYRSAVLEFPVGVYSITPGALPAVACDIYGPRAVLWARSAVEANLLTIGYSALNVNNVQRIKLSALTGFNWQYDTGAGNFVAGTSGTSTTVTISATTVAPKVGQVIKTGVYITSFGSYNGTSGTINISSAQNITPGTTIVSVDRYGVGLGFSGTSGQILDNHIIDIGFIEGFKYGINADCTQGFHVGTNTFNINGLMFNMVGILSLSGNLQFENNIFNITYATGLNTAVYSSSASGEHNVDNIYNFGALEIHRYWQSVAFYSAGIKTNQNVYNVNTLSYSVANIGNWVIQTDGISWGNIYNLPIYDSPANGFNIFCGDDVVNCQGVGNLDTNCPTRSTIYLASGTLPTYTGLRDGDRVIINNAVAGSPAAYVRSGGVWVPETYAELSGTVTLTGTGFTANPTVSAKYKMVNGQVFLYIPQGGISGTSNATTFTITGLPAAIRPTSTHILSAIQMQDAGGTVLGSASINAVGSITFGKGLLGGAWTASGAKALYSTEFSWSLD